MNDKWIVDYRAREDSGWEKRWPRQWRVLGRYKTKAEAKNAALDEVWSPDLYEHRIYKQGDET